MSRVLLVGHRHVLAIILCCATASKLRRRASTVEELGVPWQRCAGEGEDCACNGGHVRFGEGDRWVTANFAEPVVSCNISMFGEDPAYNRLKECWCGAQAQEQAQRVAIVMLSRHPPELTTWLRYHLHDAGADHIFITAEDSPQMSSIVRQLPAEDQAKVTLWGAPGPSLLGVSSEDSRPVDDYTTLQARQTAAMARARDACKEMGIDWLVHIDDDELLYSPQKRKVGDLLGAVSANFEQAYLPNFEAVYDSAEVKNCFAETDKVNMNRYTFQSYANGKSAVRVSASEARPAGPHQWRDAQNRELSSVHLDQEPFGPAIMVLHYESCPFSRWQDKFWELGNTSPDKISQIPFMFYRESISRMQACRSGSQNHPQTLSLLGCDQGSLVQLWSQWKTTANPSLKEEDLMPIHIPWKTILGH
mmetsp:Transcript_40451/g.72452  ORF Transcript_40451/g.72452 Transcript_40451/m.72452 type:complete len:419 (+) Transcript_40451:44-1300(+)